MKKKNLVFSVAAAATLLMSGPMVNDAKAASNNTTSQNTKVIYQSYNLTQDQINTILKNVQATKSVNINSILNELNIWNTTTDKTEVATNKQTEATTNKTTATTNNTKATTNNTKATTNNTKATTNKTTTEKTTATPSKTTTTDTTTNNATQTATSVSAYEKEVVELTNKERAKYGLSALTLDTELSKVARAKSQDMSTNNYFDHNSPTYGSPFDMMKQFGISYKAAGENIAKGQKTPEEVVQAWMNSEGHRANILSEKFTHIGVGYVANGNHWTQQFIGK